MFSWSLAHSATLLQCMCFVWYVLSPRTVIHPWQCTTPTGLSAMWSCSSTTRLWQIVSTHWSWTASLSRPTFSWASVTWSWRTTTRPSATCRKVRTSSRKVAKLLQRFAVDHQTAGSYVAQRYPCISSFMFKSMHLFCFKAYHSPISAVTGLDVKVLILESAVTFFKSMLIVIMRFVILLILCQLFYSLNMAQHIFAVILSLE